MQEGLWRTGNSNSVRVSCEPWVYTKEVFKLEVRNDRTTYMTMKVCELLNADRTSNEILV